MAATASLTTLPPELVSRLLGFTDPETHLSLALASKHMRNMLSNSLGYHARCHRRFHALSDISPSSLPHLLAEGRLNRTALWHVRSLEIWGARRSWDDWEKAHDLVLPEGSDTASPECQGRDELASPRPYGPGYFTQDELDAFMGILEDEMHFDHATAYWWRASIEDGCDIALKGIVAAVCPRLEDFRIVWAPVKIAQDDDHGYFERLKDPKEQVVENTVASPVYQELDLRFIGQSIRAVASSGGGLVWPPGFASLRRLAVGIRSLALPDNTPEGPEGTCWLNSTAIVPFFTLPQLESLYAAGLSWAERDPGAEDDVEITYTDPILEDCLSNIRELFFSDSAMMYPTVTRFIKACKSLKSLAFQKCDLRSFEIASLHGPLVSHAEMFRGLTTYACDLEGYRSDFCDPEDLPELSTFSAFDLAMFGIEYVVDEAEKAGGAVAMFTKRFASWLRACPSRHINVTRLSPAKAFCHELRLQELLDDALAHIFENEMVEDRDAFKLKAIFLHEVEVPDADRFRFRKAIVAGKKVGVDVITTATPVPDEVQSLLPRGASEQDLKSSPWQGHPWVMALQVHPERGIEPAGCNACGRCQVCYGRYPEKLWRERDAGTYFTEENLQDWKAQDADWWVKIDIKDQFSYRVQI
ncbi:hypothetical protein Micbo1qcDRAFT_218136 [Microdochium bolleyi]|uniref:F-box domain-containing protein n=1 Tax=Microdochium bolleyi TaxID=196109 RepID=A0A136JGF5_9PEZI|nr:hypothetical protein Micbo1qcDRAFT_218136 [Microdochium bolleyi]